jgi:glycosyltransferase involved in cell wall biosynthesis
MMRVHVLMCCHNGEAYVGQQLKSILDQEPPVDSIHIHDFGSKDETVLCVENMSANSRVPIHSTYHSDAPGASLSFFRALKMLSEELADEDIVFLSDQDDVWLPGKMASVLSALKESHTHGTTEFAIFHDVKVVDCDLNVVRPTYYTGNPFSVPRDLNPDRLLLANPVVGHTLAVSAPLIQRLVRMATPDKYLMHDWALVLFASRFGQLVFLPRALSLYRQHENNVLGAYGRRSYRDILRNVLRFSERVVKQALAFIEDTQREPPGELRRSITEERLGRYASRGVGAACAVLAVSAIRFGPTWQRKALAFFIADYGLRRS